MLIVESGSAVVVEDTSDGTVVIEGNDAANAARYATLAAASADEAQQLSDDIAQIILTSGFTIIAPCRAHTLANVNLASGGIANGTVHDAVTLVTGDRVLVMNQTTASQNGIYVAPASGSASRATDFDSTPEVVYGSYVFVSEGRAAGGYTLVTPDPITVGTTAQTWRLFALFASGTLTAVVAALPVGTTATGITSLRLDPAIGVIQTTGYTAAGSGPGTYVNDALANSALALAHPRFCFADGASPVRYWRLLGTELNFEQGGASAVAATDNRAAIQACLNYARAVGIRRVQPAQDHATYELWAPTLSGGTVYDAFDRDGPANFLTISADVVLWGRNATFSLKAYNGASIQTTTQAITSWAVWRGSGINVVGGTSGDPDNYLVNKVSLHNFTMDGGCDRVRGANRAAELAYSDLSHKGFRVQDTCVGEVYMDNVEFKRFRGEIGYFASAAGLGVEAYGHPRITLLNCKMRGSNQSALNPSSGKITCIGGEYGDATIALEALGGPGHTYIGTKFYDAWEIGLYGASGYNGFNTGGFTGPSDTGSEDLPPWTTFRGVVMDNCNDCHFNSLVRGDISSVDTSFTFEALSSGQSRSFALDLKLVDHKKGTAVVLQGPATATTAWGNGTGGYVQSLKSANLKLSHRRSAYAKANGIQSTLLLAFSGLIEQDSVAVQITASEAIRLAAPLGLVDANAKSMPRITVSEGTGLGVAGGSGNPMGQREINFGTGGVATPTYTLNPHGVYFGMIHAGLAGTTVISMGAPYTAPYDHAFGQRLRIEWNGFSTAGTVMLFPKAGTRLRLRKDRRLLQMGDWIELEYNAYTAKWHEVGFSSSTEDFMAPRVLAAGEVSTSVTPALIADSNGDWTIPVIAGTTYRIKVYGKYTSAAATTGCILNMTAVSSAAGGIVGSVEGSVTDVAAASALKLPIAALPWTFTTTDLAANTGFITAEMIFACTVSGSLELRWATEVAASTATLLAGSALTVEAF